MSERPDADSVQDALLIARQQWQLNEIRELVRSFARNGTPIAPPEAYAYLELMVDTIVDNPERAMELVAEMRRLVQPPQDSVDPSAD